MAINPNEDTEFNDALRKHGIIPPRPATPPSPAAPPSPTLSDFLDDLELSEMDERADDARTDEEERLIRVYRRQRAEEGRAEERRGRFGRVYPIGREDYTREVTEASKVCEEEDEEGRGTGVVCFLYKDGILHSDRAKGHVSILAERHPRTKFVSIVGDKCIPNLPDVRLPMIIIYRNGEVVNQLVSWGADRERKIEELEALLILAGAITPSARVGGGDTGHDEGEEGEEEENKIGVGSRNGKNIRGNEDDDEFEFDM